MKNNSQIDPKNLNALLQEYSQKLKDLEKEAFAKVQEIKKAHDQAKIQEIKKA